MVYILFFVISFLASIAGAICGIGGGVIIKPLLDSFGLMDVKTISFLSGCTVLCMSASSLIRGRGNGVQLEKSVTLPLAAGSIAGGLLGKWLFERVRQGFGNEAVLGLIQASLLLAMVLAVLAYYLFKNRITPKNLRGAALCLAVGLALGVISSFLGIGGGPANVAILCLLFSMTSKEAAKNSICIIFFSQVVSLLMTIAGGTVPATSQGLMAAGGVGGALAGLAGSAISKRLSDKGVDKVFMWMLGVIAAINVWNIVRFAAAL